MNLTGAQIILKKLIEQKVEYVFEFPGGSICPILDELHKYKKIKLFTTRHEQAAIHAADAYARIIKKPAVCMATSGPGASNLVTGIANAYMDSVPLVIITGQVAVWDMKKNRPVRQRGFQELDIISVVKSITKEAFLVRHVSDLAKTLDKAFFIAKEGRPGPVLVDVPINVQYTLTELKKRNASFNKKKLVPSFDNVSLIVEKLLYAKKPLVIVGGGLILSSAEKELRFLLKKYNLPVAETLMGLASIDADYDLNLGLVGYAGSKAVHMAIKEADFVLGLGLRFDNRAFPEARREFFKHCYIAHVDCDKTELNHRIIADKALLSDTKEFLVQFLKVLSKKEYQISQSWKMRIKALIKEEEVLKRINKLSPSYILDRLSKTLSSKEFIITTDVGQHQLWTAQYFKFKHPNSLITSGGLGTMGFGLPAAIGAKLANPKAVVINITSDGSFQMNIQELTTLKDYNLPIKILLLNNKCLGLVRQIQEYAFCKRYASTRTNENVNFSELAKGFGIESLQIKSERNVDKAIKYFINTKHSILLEFKIDEFENVFPIRIKGNVIYKGKNV